MGSQSRSVLVLDQQQQMDEKDIDASDDASQQQPGNISKGGDENCSRQLAVVRSEHNQKSQKTINNLPVIEAKGGNADEQHDDCLAVTRHNLRSMHHGSKYSPKSFRLKLVQVIAGSFYGRIIPIHRYGTINIHPELTNLHLALAMENTFSVAKHIREGYAQYVWLRSKSCRATSSCRRACLWKTRTEHNQPTN